MVALDIREQIAFGVRAGCPSTLVSEFDLEGVEEAFHRGIIVTIRRSAHRWVGFLGGGSKRIAVSANELRFMRDEDGDVHAVTKRTKDQLKAMPERQE